MIDPTARLVRYQDDLARLLAALEPAERAEVLDSVREHIEASLAEVHGEVTEPDVDRILGELGSPGAVAEAALAERPATPMPELSRRPAPAGASWREQLMARWVPPTVTVGFLVLGFWAIYPLAWVPLIVVLGLLIVSGLWTVAEKVLGAVVVLPLLNVASFVAFTGWPGGVISSIISIVLLLTVVLVLALLLRRGSKSAKRHAQENVAETPAAP